MATTTNYGWTTPDDTALVKDGAAAIRTLGTSVDTTTKNLNPSTTLGDIEYRSSSANVNTRLGIGSSGQVLTVSGGVPAWSAPAAGGMTLISSTTISSSSATHTISSIPTGYTDLRLYIRDLTVTGNAQICIRLNGQTALGYSYSSTYAAIASANSQDRAIIIRTVSGTDFLSGVDRCFFALDFPNYLQADSNQLFNGTGMYYSNGANDFVVGNFAGTYNGTGAINSISVFTPSNAINGGVLDLYGVK